jgi:hypothetical protein
MDTGYEIFETGAKQSIEGKLERYDLIPYIALKKLAETYGLGAQRYGIDNWQRGIPFSSLISRALRHIYLWLDGDDSEDHLIHAVWRLLAIRYFEETGQTHLDDIIWHKLKGTEKLNRKEGDNYDSTKEPDWYEI